ncbi:MAG: hypothetical protein RSE41_10635 [Clostridia bacterium]
MFYGINDKNNITNTPLKSNMDNISDVVCGKDFTLLIKKNGEIFGTGNNINGVLGRWKDINNNYSKSNTETTYDWVRCLQLEE